MTKIYVEFENGDSQIFKGYDEDDAICKAIAYAMENHTEVDYYTEFKGVLER